MYEREINDLFGLTPLGHPDLRPLMLYPENWDFFVHPLRKDYDNLIPEFKKYGIISIKRFREREFLRFLSARCMPAL
jgi:NADH:ubiquinone oxidoreductase 27 kD subunit